MFFVAMAVGMTTTWAQNFDLNGDGLVNTADVVHVYNYIINGESGDVEDEEFTVNGVTFKMIGVKGGTFQMGAKNDFDAWDNEKPVHSVTLSSYYIGQTEVTQALWKAVMGSNPSYFKGDKLPMESVSWNDCQEFVKKLNSLTGKQFRLPTEAEWEYACRGGDKSNGYLFSGSDTFDDVAWHGDNCYDNSSFKTHPVGTKQPNELGIYDMSGNVYEWCQDRYGYYSIVDQTNPTGPDSGDSCVFRGGRFLDEYRRCRSTARNGRAPYYNSFDTGLRLALSGSALDLNGDGVVNSADVTCLYNVIADNNKDDFGKDGEFTVNGVSFKMIAVEGGTFQMGATSEQGDDAKDNEKPVHSVTLSSYYIGQTEVTNALWEAVMGSSPSFYEGKDRPVENVSWDDCQEFISKLNVITGKRFSLPTEAQWKYACRGGNKSKGYKYSGSNNIDYVAWYEDFEPFPVATKRPNELGIYDMSGNVAEWCSDWYSNSDDNTIFFFGTARVVRGGCFESEAGGCRSSSRGGTNQSSGSEYLGLRLALSK